MKRVILRVLTRSTQRKTMLVGNRVQRYNNFLIYANFGAGKWKKIYAAHKYATHRRYKRQITTAAMNEPAAKWAIAGKGRRNVVWHGISRAPTLPLAIPPRNSTRKKAVNAYSGILTNGLTPLFSAVDRAIPYKYNSSIIS